MRTIKLHEDKTDESIETAFPMPSAEMQAVFRFAAADHYGVAVYFSRAEEPCDNGRCSGFSRICYAASRLVRRASSPA